MALRSDETPIEDLQKTVQEFDRQRFEIRERLEAIDKIYANLRVTLVGCIEKVNRELVGGQSKGERLTAHYNDKFAD